MNICNNCPYFKCHADNGSGICKITHEPTNSDECCAILTTAHRLTLKELALLLHHIQKWRRGGKTKMPAPKLVGFAIDESIRLIRTFRHTRQNKQL